LTRDFFDPLFLFTMDGDISDTSGNGYHLEVAAGGIGKGTDESYSDYAAHGGVLWMLGSGTTSLVHGEVVPALRHAGDMTIFTQVRHLTESTLADGWVVGHGGAGATEATNWQYGLLFDDPSIEWFQEYGAGLSNPENPTEPVKSYTGFAAYGLMVRRYDNGDGTWTVDYFVDDQEFGTDTFPDSAVPTGGEDGRLRVLGYDGGGYLNDCMVRNITGWNKKLTRTQISSVFRRVNGGS